jgi:DNA-binding MarR family transcriptional regulator
MPVVIQKIKKEYTQMDMAMSYYSVISALNALHLTTRELQLLAFTAIRGSITNPAARADFCEMFGTSQATMNNIISKLKKLRLFVKEQNKVRVHPAIALDFSNNAVVLQVTLTKKAS